MLSARSPAACRELGEFVRAQRERLPPQAVGLPVGPRRRTPGLRREEVAQLCGLSATWYTWIEQGRDVSVSPTALARLAATLRLNRAERAYLFDLAGKRDPEAETPGNLPGAAMTACVASIACPAYVLDQCWTAVAWNPPAERLFVGWLDQPGDRNLLDYIFLAPAARDLICDWNDRARRVAAEFRAACSARLDDVPVRALLQRLQQDSPEFAGFWNEHAVLAREGGNRTFSHPVQGFLQFDQTTFMLASAPDIRLTILVPVAAAPRSGTARPAVRPRKKPRHPNGDGAKSREETPKEGTTGEWPAVVKQRQSR